MTEETAADYKGSPKFHIAELAKADIPLILVQGDADIAAPMEENAQLLIDNYEKLGGTKFKVIIMEGKGHHPHSVYDPKPVSDTSKPHTKSKIINATPQADACGIFLF